MRLIDADALLERENATKPVYSVRAITKSNLVAVRNYLFFVVDDAPTIDAVPVVRCKDCHFCDPENHHCDHPMGTTIPVPRKPDDFCSYGKPRGERKE